MHWTRGDVDGPGGGDAHGDAAEGLPRPGGVKLEERTIAFSHSRGRGAFSYMTQTGFHNSSRSCPGYTQSSHDGKETETPK